MRHLTQEERAVLGDQNLRAIAVAQAGGLARGIADPLLEPDETFIRDWLGALAREQANEKR